MQISIGTLSSTATAALFVVYILRDVYLQRQKQKRLGGFTYEGLANDYHELKETIVRLDTQVHNLTALVAELPHAVRDLGEQVDGLRDLRKNGLAKLDKRLSVVEALTRVTGGGG